MSNEANLTDTFSALAHPVRRAILARLATGDATVSELAEPFAMSLPAISKHIKVLERAGLLSQERQAQFRPCRLNVEPLRRAVSWAEECRSAWESRFDQMDRCLRRLTENNDDRDD